MAEIPRYVSKRSVIVEERPRMSMSGIERSNEEVKGTLNAAERVTELVTKIRDVRQAGEANAFLMSRINDIKTRADAEIDLDKRDNYLGELDKLPGEVSQKISGTMASALFNADMASTIEATKHSLTHSFRTRELQASQDIVEYNRKHLIDNFTNMDPTEQTAQSKNIKSLIENAVQTGVYSKAEGMALWEDTQKKIRKNAISMDIANDQATTPESSYVFSQLQKGAKGTYADLTSQERAEAIEHIQLKINRNKRTYEFQLAQDQDKNQADMLVKWMDGRLTETDVKEGLLTQQIRVPFGEKMMKKLYSDIPASTDIGFYSKLREMQLAGASIDEVTQLVLDNPTKLSNEDKKVIVERSFKQEDKRKTEKMRYNASALRVWSRKNLLIGEHQDVDDLAGDVVYDFLTRVDKENATGNRIDEIAQETLKDSVKKAYPGTSLLQDTPHFVADRNAIRKIYERESKLKGQRVKTPAMPGTIIKGQGQDKILVGYTQQNQPIYDEITYGDTE